MPKRFIIVPERFRSSLEDAVRVAAQKDATPIPELYQAVKKYLAHHNVPHRDNQLEPHEIPDGHASWSHG